MKDENLRLQCIQEAVRSGVQHSKIVELANEMFEFIKNNKTDK